MATAPEDPAGHIGPAFREAFGSWSQLRLFIAERAQPPAFDTRRALQQLIMTDLAQRLTADPAGGWVLRGSLSLPSRPGLDPVPEAWQAPESRIDPRYTHARPVFDIDLCATAEGDIDLAAVFRRVTDTAEGQRPGHGIGLGGLLHYSTAGLRRLHNGRVVGEVTAQPIDPRRSRHHLIPVSDPFTFQVDLYPSSLTGLASSPDNSNRSTLAIDVPGLAEYRPLLHPTVDQLADKLWLPVGPHTNPPWHRYKDLFDVYYLISTCRFRVADLRRALAANPNRARIGLEALPVPYRLHHDPAGPTWPDRYEQMRAQHPALSAYPPFEEAMARIREFADGTATGPSDRTWLPARQWTYPSRRASPPRRLPPPPGASNRQGPTRRR